MNTTQFTFAELTENMINFLENYTPEDDIFTSQEEMESIEHMFNIPDIKDVEDLRVIRNSVVRWYSEKFKEFITTDDNGEELWTDYKSMMKYNKGMMSITAVIDNDMYKIKPSAV